MSRDRMIAPDPEASARQCAAHGCPLPPGCGQVCFVHDGLEARHWQEATAAVNRFDPVFRLCERMSNASPGEPVPDATLDAMRQRGIEGTETLPIKSCRQYAQGLRALLYRSCRPTQEPKRVVDRMIEHGLKPIGEML